MAYRIITEQVPVEGIFPDGLAYVVLNDSGWEVSRCPTLARAEESVHHHEVDDSWRRSVKAHYDDLYRSLTPQERSNFLERVLRPLNSESR